MKKIKLLWLLMATFPLVFISCEDDDSEVTASSQTIALLSTSSSIVEGGTAPFSVIFLGLPEEQTTDITVNYSITGSGDGTLTGSVTIPQGEQTADFNISIPDDNVFEDTLSIMFQLTDASGGFQINENIPQNSQELTLFEDVKNISISNDTLNISESFSAGGDVLELPISITNALDGEVTINYTLSGTAVEDTDFTLLSDNPLVLPAGVADTTINLEVLDDLVSEAGGKTLYVQIDGIDLADTGDEETILLEGDANRVIAYNLVDDNKIFGFDIMPTDTIVVTAPGRVSATISYSGTLINGTSLSFDNNLPAGVTLDAPSADVGFSTSETSRTIEFDVDASAFTGTDVSGTYVISSLDAAGDDETSISSTNDTIVIKIVNE